MRYVLAVCLLVLSYPVQAHDWYDPDCCNGEDCRPIDSCSEMDELPEGWVKWKGYVFKKVRPSKDAKCHVCIFRGIPQCAYIQQGS